MAKITATNTPIEMPIIPIIRLFFHEVDLPLVVFLFVDVIKLNLAQFYFICVRDPVRLVEPELALH